MADEYDAEIEEAIENEEVRVNETMRADSIFEAGFKEGQRLAGLRSNALAAFRDWLLERVA